MIFFLKAFACLPFSWQKAFARGITPLAMRFVKRRVRITEINIQKCFPDWSDKKVKEMTRKSMESFLLGAVEANATWFFSTKRFAKIPVVINGLEHVERIKKSGQGIILCGFHFHTLELTGRVFGKRMPGGAVVYQKHPNSKFDEFLVDRRSRFAAKVFKRKDLKSMLAWLKAGNFFWYAPDQDFGKTPSVFAPFFGVQTATLTAPSKMAGRTDSKLIPFFYARTDKGYVLDILPPLENYPSEDELADATRLNSILEDYIKKYPEQYLWQHRRFKTRPDGEDGFY